MEYQVQKDYSQERQYEPLISEKDELFIPKDVESGHTYSVNKEKYIELKDKLKTKVMFDQLIRLFKDEKTSQLYIEANTLFKLRGIEYNERINNYSAGLIPITAELLAKLIKEYEERYEVHVDVQIFPIDMSNNYTYNNINDFIKDNNNNLYKEELNNILNEDYKDNINIDKNRIK